MSLDTIIEIAFVGVFTGGLGTLFWARMNRLEVQIIDIRHSMATREELAHLRAEMRDEFTTLRQDVAVMRSDLTHVALAIGVNRPKPAEG